MAERIPASSSCVRLDFWSSFVEKKGYGSRNPRLTMMRRNFAIGGHNALRLSMQGIRKIGATVTKLKTYSFSTEVSCECCSFASLADVDGVAAPNLVPMVDQVLLMASIFLTYMAGVVPNEKLLPSNKKNMQKPPDVERSEAYGSVGRNANKGESLCVWDVIRGKLLDSLDTAELESDLETGAALQYEERRRKPPLSLYAISRQSKSWLLWSCFLQLELETKKVLSIFKRDEWTNTFRGVIEKSYQQACMEWLRREFGQDNDKAKEAVASFLAGKLKGDDNVLLSIRKLGKEDLYMEFLFFNIYGSQRELSCYDSNLFQMHGVPILEDLLITLADGIACIYLELTSVDGNMANVMSGIGSDICNLSTRALQRLRNEVALYQWLYQNLEAVVSMYEDRFDLHVLETRAIKKPSKEGVVNIKWLKKLTHGHEAESSLMRYVFIQQFSMPVKRIKELKALTGWRYYFSLFLEFSDISMPIVRVVLDKVSCAISFFLVTLIGRSLGLIYTGIRESLRWK